MQRSRTPPESKWLVNELAATRGELERVEAGLVRLAARRDELIHICAALEHVAEQVGAVELLKEVPLVHAHGRYGEHGALRGWLRAVLREAYPAALETSVLMEGVEKTFGLTFDSATDRRRFASDNLGSALRRLTAAGQVQRLHEGSKGPPLRSAWRWRQGHPTLNALRQSHSTE